MEKCDSFWLWGNTRKKFTFVKISSSAGGSSCSMDNKIRSVAGGSSLEGLLETMQCMDSASVRRSQRICEGKSGGGCRDLGLPLEFSNLCKHDDFMEANPSHSPISVIQSHASLFDSSHSETISCHPLGNSNPELQFLLRCSDDNLVQDRDFYERKKPSKLRLCGRGQKAGPKQSCLFSDEGIHNSLTVCLRESSVEATSSFSFSKAEAEETELQSWATDEEMRNLRLVGGSESTSTYMDVSCKRPRGVKSLISKSSFEIQKEKSELIFAGLHLLADSAVKASSEQWVRKAIFRPTGVRFWQKRVIRRRAKSASKFFFAETLMAADSEPLLANNAINKLARPECTKTYDGGVADKDQVAIPSFRSSKRSRSEFLKSKYCDSVVEELQRGTRR